MYEHLSIGCGTQDYLVAVVAGQGEEVRILLVEGKYSCTRLVHLATEIAHGTAVVNLAECAPASILHSLRAYLVVRHGVDEVLYLRTVVV